MTTIRELWVRLGANTDKASVVAFDAALADVKKTGAAVVKTLAGLTATAGAAAFGLFKLVRQTANAADAAAKGAQRYGITTEAFQELDHAAQLSGTSIDAVGTGLKKLAVESDKAARGNKSAVASFDNLGISATDTNGKLKATDELMMDLADRIAETDDPTRQLAMAVEGLGRSGEALIPMLRKGRKGIQEMRDDAKDGVISKEAAAAFEDFNDNMLRSRRIMEGWRDTLATALLPRVNGLIEGFIKWARANREVIKTRIEEFAARLGKIFDELAKTAKDVNDQVKEWGGWEAMLKRVGKSLALMGILKFAGQLGGLATAVKVIIGLFSKAGIVAAVALIKPILIGLAVIAVIAGIVLGVQDLLVWLKGGESRIGQFFERFGIAEEVKGVLMSVGQAAQTLGKLMLAWGKLIVKGWVTYFKIIWMVVGPIFGAIGALILGIWKNFTMPVLKLIVDGFTLAFGKVEGLVTWLTAKLDGAMKVVEKVMAGISKANDLASKFTPGGAARSLFGRVSEAFAPNSDNNPRTQPRQNNMNANATVNVTVNAETNASPAEIASVTSQKAGEELARQNRLAQADFAGGEL